MTTLGYWLGGLIELLVRLPWRDLGAAGVLAVTTGTLYVLLWMLG